MRGDEDYSELKREISELKAENEALHAWQSEITKVLNQMITNSENQNEKLQNLQQYAYVNRLRIESLPYELRDPDYKSDVYIPHIMTKEETRNAIIEKHFSISRFGDGEFGIIAGVGRWNFQSVSPKLAGKLLGVLQSEDEGFIVGLNRNFYVNLEDLNEADADGVRAFMRPDMRKKHAQMLSPDKTYGNAIMNEILSEDDLKALRAIWDDKDCVFIEGRNTGMGVGNDLFDNCRSIQRIVGPSENAIDKYDKIIEAAKKQPKDKLILLALGPTATALAYDLYKEGYWAVDIGHIDLYYEKFVRNVPLLQDVSIPYKYCSWDEVGERRQIEEITDPTYLSQVVDRVY